MTSTPRFSNACCVYVWSFFRNMVTKASPASTRYTCASSCEIARKSSTKFARYSSMIAPALSIPVGPPPTTTTFNAPSSIKDGSRSAASHRSKMWSFRRIASGSEYRGTRVWRAGHPEEIHDGAETQHEIVVRDRRHVLDAVYVVYLSDRIAGARLSERGSTRTRGRRSAGADRGAARAGEGSRASGRRTSRRKRAGPGRGSSPTPT